MPTYEFRCSSGHEFEQFFRKISDSPYTVACPTCGQPAQRKVSGGAGLHFKGSGFYITDYGKDGKKDLRSGAGSNPASASGESATPAAEKSGSAGGESGSTSSESTKSETSKSESSKSDSSPAKASDSGTTPGKGGTKSE